MHVDGRRCFVCERESCKLRVRAHQNTHALTSSAYIRAHATSEVHVNPSVMGRHPFEIGKDELTHSGFSVRLFGVLGSKTNRTIVVVSRRLVLRVCVCMPIIVNAVYIWKSLSIVCVCVCERWICCNEIISHKHTCRYESLIHAYPSHTYS